jgi:twitching motility protein PilT
MARLDATIERLFKQSAQEITIETGSGILLRAGDTITPVIKQPLTTQQIVGAISEILPPDMRHGFPQPGQTTFPYQAPTGAVTVKIELSGDRMRVAIAPYARPMIDLPDPPARTRPAAIELPPDPPPRARPAAIELPPEPASSKVELATPADMLHLASQAHGADPGRATAALSSAHDPAARMTALLEYMLSKKASDLHLSSGVVPMLRHDGDMVPIAGQKELHPDELKAMLWTIAPQKNKDQWEANKDTDFAHELPQARFRVNIFMDRKGIGSVMRQIPTKIITAEDLGLSKAILDLCHLSKGLVLVTGPTGSGKSTTLSAMIDYINRNREDHIITIEDPIEFVHPNKKCLVNQREVGVHTGGFKAALRAALREDPDIVLVGEMRDLETIAIAIETAETGHLVFGTLHTNTAAGTVDRIIDQFPADRQEQIRQMLSESLKGVVSQVLVKKIGGGRAAALEVLIATSGISNLIREGKTFQIPSIMQTGRNVGMVTMNDALLDLVKRKLVEPADALAKAINKAELKKSMEAAGFRVDEAAAA